MFGSAAAEHDHLMLRHLVHGPAMARGMTLNTVAGFPQSNISPETLSRLKPKYGAI